MTPPSHTPSVPRRRDRIALATLLALCLVASVALSQWAGDARATPGQARPNIVVITTDDQARTMLRGKFMPKTAKQIAGPGTTFNKAIATTPLCCPSRASLLTGQYAHNHGALNNNYALLDDKDNVLPAWLRRAGYRTAHVGKFLNGYGETLPDPFQVAPGWDIWYTTLGSTRYFNYNVSANGRRVHFGKGKRAHVTRVINRKAAWLVRRFAPDTQPLYLQVDQRAPHTESGVNSGGPCGSRAVPEVPRDEKGLRHEPLPNPPSFNEADISDKPSFVRDRPLLSRKRVKKIGKRYECGLAALRSVDRGVKKILKELKRADELDDTVVVFTSDNGFYYGEHRLARDKTHPYEEAIRVPLLIRAPQRYLGGRPAVPAVNKQVANIDLAPTFLELAGGSSCAGNGDCRVMDGRSLMPLLRGSGGWPSDRALVVEYKGASSKGTSSCEYAGVRARGHFYVEHEQVPDPLTGACREQEETELYDLSSDPFQLQNLGAGAPIAKVLEARLELLRDCSGIAGRDRVDLGIGDEDPPPVDGPSYCE